MSAKLLYPITSLKLLLLKLLSHLPEANGLDSVNSVDALR